MTSLRLLLGALSGMCLMLAGASSTASTPPNQDTQSQRTGTNIPQKPVHGNELPAIKRKMLKQLAPGHSTARTRVCILWAKTEKAARECVGR